MILSQTSPLQAPQWGSKIPSLKECLKLYSSVLKRRFWRWKTLEPSFRLQKKHFLPQLIEKKQPARKPLKPCLSCGHHLAISKLANECGAQVLKLCHHMCTYILADSVLIQSLHLIVFKRKSPGTEKPHCPQKMPLCGQPKVNLEKLSCKARQGTSPTSQAPPSRQSHQTPSGFPSFNLQPNKLFTSNLTCDRF